MSAIDIWGELSQATGNWNAAGNRRLRQLGVSLRVISGVKAWIGTDRILAESNGLYQPMPEGEPALILAEADRDRDGNFITPADLVAFRTTDPHRWWLRSGTIDVLGAGQVDRARFSGEPLRLYGRPLTWLQNEADGACIVDRHCDPVIALRGVAEVLCESEALARWLERRVRETSRPKLRISAMGADQARRSAMPRRQHAPASGPGRAALMPPFRRPERSAGRLSHQHLGV